MLDYQIAHVRERGWRDERVPRLLDALLLLARLVQTDARRHSPIHRADAPMLGLNVGITSIRDDAEWLRDQLATHGGHESNENGPAQPQAQVPLGFDLGLLEGNLDEMLTAVVSLMTLPPQASGRE